MRAWRDRPAASSESARELDLDKSPGVSETLDWARAMVVLSLRHLDRDSVEKTLGALIKDADDLDRFRESAIDEIMSKM